MSENKIKIKVKNYGFYYGTVKVLTDINMDILANTSLEECGKSRVLIGGLVVELHRRNLRSLYQKMYGDLPKSRPDDDVDYDDYDDEEE